MHNRTRATRFLAVVVLLVPTIGLAADKPDMTHLWRLAKTSWPACQGNPTHFMTTSQSECNVAKSLGYQGGCNTGNYDAEHYVSSVSFPGSVTVYRLSKGGTCNCKDTFIYTPSSYWKSVFTGQGYAVENGKEYYAWPADIGPLNEANDWGLVPVYHAYSASLCDNFYSEHPDQYNSKLASGYTCGFETSPSCVAYYAADGWIDLQVGCSHPGCSWTLTGPGGWSYSGSGTWNAPSHSLPSHGYKLQCSPMPGMITTNALQTPYFPFFTSNQLVCEYECDNDCSYNGQTQCYGSGYHTCQQNANGCLTWSNTISCDDGNPCTTGDSCANGSCVAGTPKDCSYLDSQCATGICANGNCIAQPQAGACNDGDLCTTGDQCNNGECVGTPMDCSFLDDACNDGVCSGGQCITQPKPGSCDDGIECTVDGCDVNSGCTHTPDNALCDNGNPCTQDTCHITLDCQHTPVAGACSDGNPCTDGDTCAEGTCLAGPPKDCDDGNLCTDDWCDPDTGCVHDANSAPCDDGSDCTTGDHCANGLCTGTLLPDCCATDADCPNPMPQCQTVACIANQCHTTPFCPVGQCGPSPCDATLDCGACLAVEVCIDSWCKEKCDLADKDLTRCTNDGTVLEKCVQDPVSGAFYWQPTDCLDLGEAGCAYSQDKGLFVCCTPDCAAKACGKPSACGISCGSCDAGSFCCLPGEACGDDEPANLFQCLDCCLGLECGPSPAADCAGESCGTCPGTHVCKEGICVSGCEDAGVDEVGICAGNVAWWCEISMGKEVLKEVDCSEFLATCCMDEELGRVGCCTCEEECADKGWECGLNTCGEPCGDYDGECAPGFNCVPETHQCLCQMPELCYPDATPADTLPETDKDTTGGTIPIVVEEDAADGGRKSGGCSAGPGPQPEAMLTLLLMLAGFLALRRRTSRKARMWRL